MLISHMNKKISVIQACWINDNTWCEFCSNNTSKKTYLPYHSKVLNPEHICEVCVKKGSLGIDFEIVDFFESEIDYKTSISKL